MAYTPPSLPFRLRHKHLRLLTRYPRSYMLQENLLKTQLSYTASQNPSHFDYDPSRTPPDPALLTFQMPPTYTCGRREIASIEKSQIMFLKEGLEGIGRAGFKEVKRGGQTTFHGPGQLVAYLVCNLKRHGLDVRGYVKLLEESVIDVCKELGLGERGLGTREDAPGVWVGMGEGEVRNEQPTGPVGQALDADLRDLESPAERGEGKVERQVKKLASVGVHLRRFVSSYGVALNVCTHLDWFKRIEACGMPGHLVTSMLEQGLEWKDRSRAPALRRVARGRKGHVAMFELEGVMGDIALRLRRAIERRLLGFDPLPLLRNETQPESESASEEYPIT